MTKFTCLAALPAWWVVAAAPALGQQTSLQPAQELPGRIQDSQLQEPGEEEDSQQGPPVMTHAIPSQPDDPLKPDEPESTTTRDEGGASKTAPVDSGQHEGSPGEDSSTETRGNSASGSTREVQPGFGTQTSKPRPEPGAADYARFGRGSLLDRPPARFAPLAESEPQTPRPAVAADADHEPCEVLVVSKTMDDAQAARQDLSTLSIEIRRRYALPELGIVLSVFCAPGAAEMEQPLGRIGRQFPSLTIAPNHRYTLVSEPQYYAAAMGWRNELRSCGTDRRIGLVDTGIDVRHEAFTNARLKERKLLPPGTREADHEHGTATASVLAGTQGRSPGLVNTANLVAANVFRRRSSGDIDTTAELLARAVNWLLEEGVEIINMSLAGPANRVLERAIEAASSSEVVIVAAAGNGDRNPVFPAAYPGVVAVTAVDAHRRIYAQANRGDYIDFAAPGVDLFLAAPGNRSKYYTGTSFAAPFVTAALAVTKSRYPGAGSAELVERLTAAATDLGEPGRDATFGWGLVQAPADCANLATRD
ncbi:MAG: S8 family serine peptidase [Gammaproteobacteria bacterium]|nr:S8 family serine peptidase [Gammaproteobacteria bacterium]